MFLILVFLRSGFLVNRFWASILALRRSAVRRLKFRFKIVEDFMMVVLEVDEDRYPRLFVLAC
jgi:hypothetical protein